MSTALQAALDVPDPATPAVPARIVADGKFLRVASSLPSDRAATVRVAGAADRAEPPTSAGDDRFLIKGVTYGTFAPDADGLLKCRVFPGLWLDTAALLRGDMKAVLAALRRGLQNAEHCAFLASNSVTPSL